MKLMQKLSLATVPCALLIGSIARADDQWPYYGGTQWGERHAVLSKIGTHNVAEETGKTLWQFNTGAGVNAPPITFMLD